MSREDKICLIGFSLTLVGLFAYGYIVKNNYFKN